MAHHSEFQLCLIIDVKSVFRDLWNLIKDIVILYAQGRSRRNFKSSKHYSWTLKDLQDIPSRLHSMNCKCVWYYLFFVFCYSQAFHGIALSRLWNFKLFLNCWVSRYSFAITLPRFYYFFNICWITKRREIYLIHLSILQISFWPAACFCVHKNLAKRTCQFAKPSLTYVQGGSVRFLKLFSQACCDKFENTIFTVLDGFLECLQSSGPNPSVFC